MAVIFPKMDTWPLPEVIVRLRLLALPETFPEIVTAPFPELAVESNDTLVPIIKSPPYVCVPLVFTLPFTVVLPAEATVPAALAEQELALIHKYPNALVPLLAPTAPPNAVVPVPLVMERP